MPQSGKSSRDDGVRSFKASFVIHDKCMSKISANLKSATSDLAQHFPFPFWDFISGSTPTRMLLFVGLSYKQDGGAIFWGLMEGASQERVGVKGNIQEMFSLRHS